MTTEPISSLRPLHQRTPSPRAQRGRVAAAWPMPPRSPLGRPYRRGACSAGRCARCRCASCSPAGDRIGAGGPSSPVMRIVRPDAFFRRLGGRRQIGFGESYMAGDWTAHRPGRRCSPRSPAKLSTLVPPAAAAAARRCVERPPAARARRNTVEGARENIHRHYDLSNELFALFLDETMTYSVGLLRRPAATTSPTPSAARSTAARPGRRRRRAAGCWRSAPAGASWPSAPRSAAPG